MSSKVKIRELVETFVGDLDRLIRESVWETAQQSLGMTGITARVAAAPAAPRAPRAAKAGKRAKAARPAAAPVAAAAAAPAPKKAGRRKKGQKRNPADIDRLTERLLAAIAAKPGQRMEHLGKQVGASTAELLIPTTRLIEGKKIRRTGEKRATQYYPAK
jgi:hypothetical protein